MNLEMLITWGIMSVMFSLTTRSRNQGQTPKTYNFHRIVFIHRFKGFATFFYPSYQFFSNEFHQTFISFLFISLTIVVRQCAP